MEIYISINGVLRNFLQKFEYHYNDYFLDTETYNEEKKDDFDYGINYPIRNNNILGSFKFQSKEEYNNFCFIEFSLEIFGHAGLSYSTAISDLNKIIYTNPNTNFTLIGVDELGKAKPSTLFFLSKNGFLGNNIRFITSNNVSKEWKKCDAWITDDKKIIDNCPKNKIPVKFNTDYNQYFNCNIEINNLLKINELCLTSSEKPTTSILMKSLKDVVQTMGPKILTKIKTFHQ